MFYHIVDKMIIILIVDDLKVIFDDLTLVNPHLIRVLLIIFTLQNEFITAF